MNTFNYSAFANFVYWHANFPLSVITLLHAVVSAMVIPEKPIYILWLIIDLTIVVILNWFYFRNYKIFPRKIDLNEKGIICYDYIFSKKKIILNFEDINDMRGGPLAGMQHKPIYIYSDKNNAVVGIKPHLKNYNQFLTLVLSKVKKELYEEILNRVDEFGKIIKSKREKRKAKKKKK